MIGVIFCRGCSEKLDIDNITPDDVTKAAKKSNVGNIIRQTIGVLVLVAIIGLLVALFLAPPFPVVTTLEGEALTRAQKKQLFYMEHTVETDVDFTMEEFMTLARIELGLTPELVDKDAEKRSQEGTTVYLVPQEYHIVVVNENRVKLILKSEFQAFDEAIKLPVYTTLICNVVNSGEKAELEVVDASMGRIPMFGIGPAVDKMVQRHRALTDYNEPVQDFFRATKAVTVTESAVKLKRKAQAAK